MYQKAESSMDSKASGRVRDVIRAPTNAPLPTLRRCEGRVTEVICAEAKAPSSMNAVSSATVYEPPEFFACGYVARCVRPFVYRTPSRLW